MVFVSSYQDKATFINKSGVLMAFDWIEYLYLAQDLSGMTPDEKVTVEAKDRTAIGRAYYAAFWKARNFLRDKEGFIPIDKVHESVRNQFLHSDSIIKRKIGENLRRLCTKRNKADYEEIWSVNLSAERSAALLYTNEIISALSSLSQQSP